MIISDVTLSYPYIQHRVEISHFTARKSTAIEWLILESINKCESLHQYERIGIGDFFEQFFTISDADQLIRPCLIALQDMGAIMISGIDDETELKNIPMCNLKLTKTGKEMQVHGLLPGTTTEDIFTIYYDLISEALRDDANIYKEDPTGIKVIDIEDASDAEFPSSAIREWILSIQRDKKKNRMNWLTPTTRIEDITSLDATLLWKNVSRKVELKEGLVWKIVGEENQSVDEITLSERKFIYPEEFVDLPRIIIDDPDKEIKSIVPITEVNSMIKKLTMKDDLFCVNEKYYFEMRQEQSNSKKKIRIGVVYGATEFEVSNKSKQIIIKIKDNLSLESGLYVNAKENVQVGVITVSAGSISKDMPVAYIPENSQADFISEMIRVVNNYYEKDYLVLFILTELGRKALFLEYVSKLIGKEETISKKVDIIEAINTKSIAFYNQKIISAMDRERLLVNETYIVRKAGTVEGAIAIIDEYSTINAFTQDENLFQRIIKIILENLGSQDELDDIWKIWKTIEQIKRNYLNWINKAGLYKKIYSKKSLLNLFERFSDEQLFNIDEFTTAEQTVCNMRRIYLRIQEMLPEIDLYSTASTEKYNEVVLAHIDLLNNLYDDVRQWKDEEERVTNKVINIDEILGNVPIFTNVARNIDGLRNSLALFFNDSFMKYSKVFIVDTCILMHEPTLISWFDDGKALLVIPVVVLEELDRKKVSRDEDEAYNAREAIRNISNYKTYDWINVEEVSYPDLISNDLDKNLNDNKILSIALKYSAKQPILLTDDINFGNVADSQKVKNMNLSAYKAMKEHERLSENNKKANGKKNKKKRK